jgi:hypothetical protein
MNLARVKKTIPTRTPSQTRMTKCVLDGVLQKDSRQKPDRILERSIVSN